MCPGCRFKLCLTVPWPWWVSGHTKPIASALQWAVTVVAFTQRSPRCMIIMSGLLTFSQDPNLITSPVWKHGNLGKELARESLRGGEKSMQPKTARQWVLFSILVNQAGCVREKIAACLSYPTLHIIKHTEVGPFQYCADRMQYSNLGQHGPRPATGTTKVSTGI